MKIDARRMVTGRGLLVTVVAAGALAAGGTTAAFATAHDGPSASPSASPSAPPSASPSAGAPGGAAPDPSVALAQAVDAALRKVPGTVAEAELDDEHGKAVWEFDVLAQDGTWRDVTVDSGTGEVLGDRADGNDDHDGAAEAALRKATLSAPAAADAALKAVQGHVTSAEFEHEHGKAFWEVDVTGKDGAEHEVTVDAASGKVLAQATDEPDGDDDED
jgi:uncharacterized membrane protein YkoI